MHNGAGPAPCMKKDLGKAFSKSFLTYSTEARVKSNFPETAGAFVLFTRMCFNMKMIEILRQPMGTQGPCSWGSIPLYEKCSASLVGADNMDKITCPIFKLVPRTEGEGGGGKDLLVATRWGVTTCCSGIVGLEDDCYFGKVFVVENISKKTRSHFPILRFFLPP